MKKKLVILMLVNTALLLTFGCSEDGASRKLTSELDPSLTSPVAAPAPMVFDISWSTAGNPNFISFSLTSQPETNKYYKRVDLYSDAKCQELIDILTPAELEANLVMWPANPGVVNHVAVIETDINNVRRACKVVASSSTVSDVIPPSSPENLTVNYNWLTNSSLEISASWSASQDNDSHVEYTVYVMADPNGYAQTLASLTTSQLNTKFILDTANLSGIDRLYFRIVAADQANNISFATTDSGIYVGTAAPLVNIRIAYLYLGDSGLNINLSGTCIPGLKVNFLFNQMSLFSKVLPQDVDCPNGSYSISFPALYSWYQDFMSVKAYQVDANGVRTEYVRNFVNEEYLDLVLQY